MLENAGGVEVLAPNVRVGGGGAGEGNVISGNTSGGLIVRPSATGVVVQGNRIGTSPDGSTAVANGFGLALQAPGLVGGAGDGEGNVIGGNTSAPVDISSEASGFSLIGNRIGIDFSGNPVPNSSGDAVSTSGSGTIAGNIIAASPFAGIRISSTATVTVLGNTIGGNEPGLANQTGILVFGTATIGGLGDGEPNTIIGHKNDGVEVSGSAARAFVRRNQIMDNGWARDRP